MKLVLAIWEDASDADEGVWVDRAGLTEAEPVIFHQVGWVYTLTSTELVLTHCVGKHQIAPRSRIPAGMIRSLVELTEGEPVKIPKRKRKA